MWGGNYYAQEADLEPMGFSPVVEMVLSAEVRFLPERGPYPPMAASLSGRHLVHMS